MKMQLPKFLHLTKSQQEQARNLKETEMKEKADKFISEYKEICTKYELEFAPIVNFSPNQGVFPQLTLREAKKPEINEELKKLNGEK